jgi:hypothetical protein
MNSRPVSVPTTPRRQMLPAAFSSPLTPINDSSPLPGEPQAKSFATPSKGINSTVLGAMVDSPTQPPGEHTVPLSPLKGSDRVVSLKSPHTPRRVLADSDSETEPESSPICLPPRLPALCIPNLSSSETEPESDAESPEESLRQTKQAPAAASFNYIGSGNQNGSRSRPPLRRLPTPETQDSSDLGSLPSVVADFVALAARREDFSFDSQSII